MRVYSAPWTRSTFNVAPTFSPLAASWRTCTAIASVTSDLIPCMRPQSLFSSPSSVAALAPRSSPPSIVGQWARSSTTDMKKRTHGAPTLQHHSLCSVGRGRSAANGWRRNTRRIWMKMFQAASFWAGRGKLPHSMAPAMAKEGSVRKRGCQVRAKHARLLCGRTPHDREEASWCLANRSHQILQD